MALKEIGGDIIAARRETVGGRNGLTTVLSNTADGQAESITVSTTHLKDGNVLFLVGVAPSAERAVYEDAFSRVRRSPVAPNRPNMAVSGIPRSASHSASGGAGSPHASNA